MDQVFTYRSLVHAISGATGGITAISVFYPLNRVRTRLQVSDSKQFESILSVVKQLVKEEGIGSLYQGWWSAVVSLGTSNFVYFYAYNGLKVAFQTWLRRQGRKTTIGPVVNLAIASVAGIINVLLTTPLWVAGTRLTVQEKKAKASRPYTGVVDCLTRIYKEEGAGALWNGVGPSLILVSNPSIQFVVYENVRKIVSRRAAAQQRDITALEFFVVGAIAKAVATVLTYPLQIAQSRLRASAKAAKEEKAAPKSSSLSSAPTTARYTGTIDCLTKLYGQNGLRGIYRGMEAKLWQTVLTAAFQFLTYEQIQMLIFRLLLGDGPAPPTGSISKPTHNENEGGDSATEEKQA